MCFNFVFCDAQRFLTIAEFFYNELLTKVEKLQKKLAAASDRRDVHDALQPAQLNRLSTIWSLEREVSLLEECLGGQDVLNTPALR